MPSPSSPKRKAERCIPVFLQQKLAKEGGDNATTVASPAVEISRRRNRSGSTVSSSTGDHRNTFTATQLEDFIWKTSQTMVELQKQIQRGEETYYEETSHGSSLYRGFETFIDARDVGTVSGPSSSRRMPGDYRWFSSSCFNISRFMKPRPFVPVAPPSPLAAAPLSGQKRPAAKATTSPPAKERKVEEAAAAETAAAASPEASASSEMKTPDKATASAPTSATKSGEPKQRRTTRKRKANS